MSTFHVRLATSLSLTISQEEEYYSFLPTKRMLRSSAGEYRDSNRPTKRENCWWTANIKPTTARTKPAQRMSLAVVEISKLIAEGHASGESGARGHSQSQSVRCNQLSNQGIRQRTAITPAAARNAFTRLFIRSPQYVPNQTTNDGKTKMPNSPDALCDQSNDESVPREAADETSTNGSSK